VTRVIVRAVALPGTPLLVPGAAGSATVLTRTRAQVLDALGALRRGAAYVVVLDCSARGAGLRRGVVRPGLEAVGIEPRWCGWGSPCVVGEPPVAGVPASVGLLALGAAGWDGAVEVVEVGPVPGPALAVAQEVLADPGGRLVVVTGAHGPGEATERAVLDALARTTERVVEPSTGEYEQRTYEVVRFSVPEGARAATLPG
jgi:hypothetical protein